jgi:hypothetical protein
MFVSSYVIYFCYFSCFYEYALIRLYVHVLCFKSTLSRLTVGCCRFGKYYKFLVESYQLFPSSEWEAFEKVMKTPLPTTFRLAHVCTPAAQLSRISLLLRTHTTSLFGFVFLLNCLLCIWFVVFALSPAPFAAELKRIFGSISEQNGGERLVIDGEEVLLPRPIVWFPNEMAWSMTISRKQLRKVAGLKKLHSFLLQCEGGGHTTRQEAVSMVPPLFLEVEPHHTVIDLCAAPGSKTSQVITIDSYVFVLAYCRNYA